MCKFHVRVRRRIEYEEVLVIEGPEDLKISELENLKVLDSKGIKVIGSLGEDTPRTRDSLVVAINIASD